MSDLQPSLYERLGGETAIMAAVALFYEKVMADQTTSPFFAGLDMEAQTKKQIAFMSRAFGGPTEWNGRDLREAHVRLVKEMGLTDVHFDAVAGHLTSTLQDLGIDDDVASEVLGIVASTREQVLNR